MTKLTFNENKSIGQVIYIVEGDVTEPELLSHIYSKILKYTVINYNKIANNCICLQGKNKYSKVFIIPASNSAIKLLLDSESTDEYFDSVYSLLAIKYGLDVENSAIYYIFDRDRGSNRPKHIIKAIKTYHSSRPVDSDEMNGLFSLSYPSIESYLIQANDDSTEMGSGSEAKKYIREKDYYIDSINKDNLLLAARGMIEEIEKIMGFELNNASLDSFEQIGMNVLEYEDNKWMREKKYRTLSQVSLSLIDLGILYLEQ